MKYGICYISAINGPIATKRKANISIELKASNVTMGFDLGHDLDLELSRSNMEFAISQSKVIRRSGVRIYKIVTEVTSDVGVPSTHVVCYVYFCSSQIDTYNAKWWLLGYIGFVKWNVDSKSIVES